MSVTIRDAMRVEAKRLEEDGIHSAKSHFEAARSWSVTHYLIGTPVAILAAAAGTSAFQGQELATAMMAMAAAILSAAGTVLNPAERAASHQSAGAKYLSLRNRARIFQSVQLSSLRADADLEAQILELAQQRNELNESSPGISRRAFRRARQGIEAGEAKYEADRLR